MFAAESHPGVSQSDGADNQIEGKAILNESRHHFEGIRGESHPANGSYVFENIIISGMRVSQTAEVAGFWGLRRTTEYER